MDLSRQSQKAFDLNGDDVGDCWKTVIACLLEIPADDVPHFVAEDEKRQEWEADWWQKSVEFVEKAKPGWTLLMLKTISFPVYSDSPVSPKKIILVGTSPRGSYDHAVLAEAKSGKVIWDPHPSSAGILDTKYMAVLTAKMKKSNYTFNWDVNRGKVTA